MLDYDGGIGDQGPEVVWQKAGIALQMLEEGWRIGVIIGIYDVGSAPGFLNLYWDVAEVHTWLLHPEQLLPYILPSPTPTSSAVLFTTSSWIYSKSCS